MRLSTGCPPLDELLGGGLEPGAITLVYGEAGTGKTNLCLQASVQAVLQGKGKVAFVDSEGVSMERLSQIAGPHLSRVVKNILFFSPGSLAEQERTVRSLQKIASPSLLAVDSINMFYRLGLGVDGGDQAQKALTGMMGDLLRLTRTKELPALVTGQVYTGEEGALAFGGRIMEHIVKTILRLERVGPGVRRAVLVKHRSQPEGSVAEFFLTREGLGPEPLA